MLSTVRRWNWLRPRFTLRLLFVAVTLAGIASAYLGSYVSRSSRGRYQPMVIGTNGVKWYDWAPAGFADGYDWNESLMRFYYPLWQLDRRFWHYPLDGSERTTYPITEVRPEEIGKVYEAWLR